MRTLCKTQKVKSPFGAMYISVDYLPSGRVVSGHISDPGKEPDSQVAKLIIALSKGMSACLRAIGEETR